MVNIKLAIVINSTGINDKEQIIKCKCLKKTDNNYNENAGAGTGVGHEECERVKREIKVLGTVMLTGNWPTFSPFSSKMSYRQTSLSRKKKMTLPLLVWKANTYFQLPLISKATLCTNDHEVEAFLSQYLSSQTFRTKREPTSVNN